MTQMRCTSSLTPSRLKRVPDSMSMHVRAVLLKETCTDRP